ncbi:hypothetical protein LUZ60_009074 [Juncus effusus]|nr:hypothetical protein LUZ60_009074 [Juncus effusus]
MATSQIPDLSSPNPDTVTQDQPQMEQKKEQRNWAELNGDILMEIFGKMRTLDVLMSVGSVCRAWRNVAKDEPELWRRINMTRRVEHMTLIQMNLTKLAIGQISSKRIESVMMNLTKIAIDRSRGRLEQFWIEYFGDNDLLQYLCDRTSVLKSLRLIGCLDVLEKGVVKTAKRQPLLEELELKFVIYSKKFPERVGKALPNLKQLKLNRIGISWGPLKEEEFNNAVAFGIAKTMHQLRHLHLVGPIMSNRGLTAILKGCPHLETLEMRMSYNFKMDSDTRARCARLTYFRNSSR